jgi:hypothetical protein
MSDWPDSVPVLFVDGPLAGEVHDAPARAGLPPILLRVRLGESDVEVCPADVQASDRGWVSYMGLGMSGRRAIAEHEPWAFVYAD